MQDNRQMTEKEITLYEYLEKLDAYRKQRNAKVERVLKLLDDIDGFVGLGYVLSNKDGLNFFLQAQELAREILKDDAASKHNKPPTA